MSTIKSNNVQLGQSVTATNNFTWYQPASPDGTVRLGNGNAGSVTDLITVGSTGDLTFANSISLSAASTKTLTLNGGAGSNGLVIDASNNVGIGYNTPGTYRVYVKSTDTAVWAANTSQSQILNYNAGAANNSCSTMEYQVVYGDSTVGGVKIGAVASASYSGDFVIANRNNGTYQENLRLTYNGNLGLGVTPSAWTNTNTSAMQLRNVSIAGISSNDLHASANAYYDGSNWRYIAASVVASNYYQNAGTHVWRTTGTTTGAAGSAITFNQAMTLDASGNLLVGKTSTSNYGDGSQIYPAGTIGLGHPSGTGSGAAYALFGYAGGGIGSITQSGTTSVNFNGNSVPPSDIRLKENLYLAPSALPVLEKLQIKSFDWKGDGNHQTYGVIAQEVLEVFPEFVSVPDESDKMLGINQSAMVPFLVKAIQELSAELNELKQKVNA